VGSKKGSLMDRAYSIVNIKEVDEERRVIRGIATTPSVDRVGDIVEPGGVRVAADIPLFLYHDSKQTVGRARLGKGSKTGIPFEASLPHVKEAGRLKDRVDEAWQMLKYRLITGVSIGFNVLNENYERMKDGGLRFLETEILELSLVPIPANADATITSIKSIALQAASGRTQSDPTPAVVGTKQPAPNGGFFVSQPQSKQVKTISELRTERETKAARMGELMQLRKANDGTFGDAERAEYDAASNEVDSLDDDIRELKFHAVNSQGARAAEGTTQRSAVASRGRTLPTSFGAKDDEFLGQSYTRRVIAKALAAMNYGSAVEVASQRYKSNPLLVEVIKADVAGGGAGSGEWGAELVSADNRFNGDFIKFLHSKTVFDSLPLRSVPANVTIKGQDGAATANWVGESKAIPATAADFSTVSLTPQKVAAIAVVSNELLRDSSPSAEMLVRDALVEASAQKVDTHFFSTTAASSGVYPAGILNGVVVGTTGGATEAELIGDIAGLMRNFITAKYDINGLVWCMSPLLALQISLMRNALGQNAFATMPNTLEGRPVYSGHNVGTGDLILMSAGDIWKIGDSGVQVSISREATIEQDDAPQGATDTPVTMSTKFTNMFQAESTAIKVVRSINWAKRRTGAVHYIGNATYGELQSV
jgi:HK97 family phage prohead protease